MGELTLLLTAKTLNILLRLRDRHGETAMLGPWTTAGKECTATLNGAL